MRRVEWDLNGPLPGMPQDAWESQQPELCRDSQSAMAVWNFCLGWNPSAFPMAIAYYDIDDIELLIDQLLVLRDYMNKRDRNRNG